MVADSLGLYDQRVGDRAVPAFVEVNRVVTNVDRDEVLDIEGATEHLDAVVECGVNLEVADLRAAANTAEGDTVQLVTVADSCAGVLDHNVVEDA